MDALRCPPDDADVTKLSGGERRRVALCKLLLDQPELLLLDEPTNHLDAESVSWLEGHLRNYPGAILIVTHDRYFLDNVTSLDSRTRPRQGHSLRGQLLVLAGAEAEAARAGRPRGRRASAHAGARAGMDRGLAEGAPGQIQGALPALRGTAEAGQREADPDRADHDSRGRAARPERDRFRGPDQGLWRPRC